MFKDRFDAGQQLAQKLVAYKEDPNAIILAVPRGALEIGSVLSHELKLPLDIILTKKIGHPENPEYAIGVVSLENTIIDKQWREYSGEFDTYIKNEIQAIKELLKKRYQEYRDSKPPLDLKNKIVIVVDDGVATGKTLEGTLEIIRKENPQKIIVAVPVASKDALKLLKSKADEVICLLVPEVFLSVSQFYRNFDQVDDSQAIALLQSSYFK
jgi:putative phosphoribosyl transferase